MPVIDLITPPFILRRHAMRHTIATPPFSYHDVTTLLSFHIICSLSWPRHMPRLIVAMPRDDVFHILTRDMPLLLLITPCWPEHAIIAASRAPLYYGYYITPFSRHLHGLISSSSSFTLIVTPDLPHHCCNMSSQHLPTPFSRCYAITLHFKH